MSIVVDSSVWIDHLRNRLSDEVLALRSFEAIGDIVVGDLVLLEVLRGARSESHAAAIEHELRQFRVERMLDDRLAVAGARTYRRLRRAGLTIRKTTDLVIASFCVARGYRLLHSDRDLDLLAAEMGLQVAT